MSHGYPCRTQWAAHPVPDVTLGLTYTCRHLRFLWEPHGSPLPGVREGSEDGGPLPRKEGGSTVAGVTMGTLRASPLFRGRRVCGGGTANRSLRPCVHGPSLPNRMPCHHWTLGYWPCNVDTGATDRRSGHGSARMYASYPLSCPPPGPLKDSRTNRRPAHQFPLVCGLCRLEGSRLTKIRVTLVLADNLLEAPYHTHTRARARTQQ